MRSLGVVAFLCLAATVAAAADGRARGHVSDSERGGTSRSLDALPEPLPEEAVSLVLEGESFRKQGEPERAVDCCEQAIRLAPRWPGARWASGIARMDLGQVDAAIADYTEAIWGCE